MGKMILPADTLFDILSVLSFYRFVSGCTIWFRRTGAKYEAVIEGDDLLKMAVFYAKKICDDLQKGELFGIQWQDTHNYDLGQSSNLTRCYIHESLKKVKKGELVEKKSPLITSSGNMTIFSLLSKSIGKGFFGPWHVERAFGSGEPCFKEYYCHNCKHNVLCQKICVKCRFDRIVGVLGKKVNCPECSQNTKIVILCIKCFYEYRACTGVVLKKGKLFRLKNYSSYTFNLVDYYVSCKANVVSCTDMIIPTKSLFVATGLMLFPCHLARGRTAVDGFDLGEFCVPLSARPIKYEEWRLLQRNPGIHDWNKHREFWCEVAGVLTVRRFQIDQKNKGNFFSTKE